MDKTTLLSSEISDELVSEIFYTGKWEDIEVLKDNPRFATYEAEVWPYLAKDREFFWTPWIPIFVVFFIMIVNLYFRMYQQFYSAVMALLTLGYVTYIIPLINDLKEKNRIQLIDELLLNTPFHRTLYPKINEMVEKVLNPPPVVIEEKKKEEAPNKEASKK